MKRIMIVSVAMLGLAVTGVVSAGLLIPSSTTLASAKAATSEQRQMFAIENMTCALCPVTVKKAMEGVSGVKSVAIDFEAQTATVVFDPSTTTIDTIAQASTNAGYPAHATKS
jgi:mercuric ion binding protein